MFPGFFRPKSNCYRLPNDWFDIWTEARSETGRTRILGLLKVTAYVIKWTWGYQNYDEPVRITRRDFQYGQREGKRQLDRGTGLSSRSLENGLRLAEQLGFIESYWDEEQDGPSFLPRLRPPEEDPPGFLQSDEGWMGFERPEANFFFVPAIWTDLTAGRKKDRLTSEIVILAAEYFFRHTWGWKDGWDEPCWIGDEEVAHGRRYRSKDRRGERYDQDIGYSLDRVEKALREGVRRGWLVWRKKSRRREYALHLKGMIVSEAGEFLGSEKKGREEADTSPPCPNVTEPVLSDSAQAEDADSMGAEIARLRAQVTALAQTVETLLGILQAAGLATGTACGDESKAQNDESTAEVGRKYSASYTDTLPDTLQTPPPDTAALTGGDGGGGGDDLQERLTSLNPPVSRETAAALITTHGPQPIWAWLDALERDPTVRSVAALLIHKLRTGQTPPKNSLRPQPDPDCPLCRGAGVIEPDVPETDPDYSKTFPCPRCSGKNSFATPT